VVMLGERQAKSSGRTVKFQRKGRFQTSGSLNCEALLLPFSAETCGGMAPDAITLLDTISEAGKEHLSLWSHAQIVQHMLCSVASCISYFLQRHLKQSSAIKQLCLTYPAACHCPARMTALL
jgi:hypothetical protein